MLEVILDKHLLSVLMGVAAAAGIISKGVVSFSLKSLTKAAGNMGKSSHGLMRLVRAKYEHACMVSDKVQNVEVFIEKYIYEYKIAGIRLYGWRRLERASAWACFGIGLLAAGAEYLLRGMSDQVLRNAASGAVLGILLFLLRSSMDENYRLDVIRTYMVDYLDNVCARRMEKNRELNDPDRTRPQEAPAPREKPEILAPDRPESYRAPETGVQPEGMKAADRVRAAKKRDMAEEAAAPQEAESAYLAESLEQLEEEKPQWKEPEEKKKTRASRKKETAADKPEDKSWGTSSKEVLIREILEEFLA